MPVLIGLLVTVLIEIVVLIFVGEAIGVLPTLLLVLATSALGAFLLRREGVKAYRAFAQASAAGRVPAREAADGVLVLVGGLLLVLPGFVSDVIGLLLLAPPTRALLRGPVTAFVGRRLAGRVIPGFGPGTGFGGWTFGGPRFGRRGSSGDSGDIVEGEVVDERPDRTDPPRALGE